MMHDIVSTGDIELFVDEFYKLVNDDELLGPVFNNSAGVDWQKHVEKMYRFWGTLLLGTMNYNGSPFDKHLGHHIGPQHFERWLTLFYSVIDKYFCGPKATEAKQKASNIGMVFQAKLENLEPNN